jgi:DNA-binding response OmpR family regulator
MSQVKCRILCVDDYEDTSETLKMLLSMSDYEVHTARTIDEALKLAQTHEFDLYIFDKRLPDGSGVELCEKLTKLTPGVPCIFYSGDAYEIHRQQGLAAGAHAYIPKPDIEALVDSAHKLLSERECATA